MLFTVIVPTCDRPDALTQCLERLAPGRQAEAVVKTSGENIPEKQEGTTYEVIVTDDGVRSQTAALIAERYAWATWTRGPRRGPAANRNHGASIAIGDWLVFVDDDCVPDLQIVSGYDRARAEHPGARVLEGRTYVDRPRRTLAECAPANETGGYLWSCNFAIERALFTEMGGFNERFKFAAVEDVDFRLRLRDRGCAFSFVKDAAVCHPWRPRHSVKEVSRHRQSLEVLISLRPEMAKQFSWRSVAWVQLRMFLKVTLPGIIAFRGRGMFNAIGEHIYTLYRATFFPLRPR
jgi:GT2 family glycosyltransferase